MYRTKGGMGAWRIEIMRLQILSNDRFKLCNCEESFFKAYDFALHENFTETFGFEGGYPSVPHSPSVNPCNNQ